MSEGEQGGRGDTLTVSPWDMQESGAGGVQADTWAGGSNNWKASSAAADKAGPHGRGAVMGRGRGKGGKRRQVVNVGTVTLGVQGKKGFARPLEWTPSPTE